jgi:hypothetical protein
MIEKSIEFDLEWGRYLIHPYSFPPFLLEFSHEIQDLLPALFTLDLVGRPKAWQVQAKVL